ncbi:SRPBCC family protein [Dactylosporangium fulvum]|uniref:SRPBCC family protein n=1 Tax=Dactylosporangium fulvum TaxID=53359 RepID=A0ABY5WA77_9ACTN|nr:SRPBCC family protein [Dactylosporangium fulvum]UWP86250.1 SRPBCC family protein [Dactylosporangium fulvum]
MIDIVNEISAIHRDVVRRPAGSGEVVSVVVRRTYDADVEDVWDALTDPDRIKRWFMPISGDLRPGGAFQLEGNAGGDVLECERPRRFKVTFGAPNSLVEVRLSGTANDRTEFVLEHTVPIEMAGSGAGALFVGPGWDGGTMGLGLFLRDEAVGDPVAAANSPEVVEFNRHSVQAWIAAVEASGTATADEIAAGTEVALRQYVPDQQS